MKTSIIERSEIVGQRVGAILVGDWEQQDRVEYARLFVRTVGGLLVEIDFTGVDSAEPLRGYRRLDAPCAVRQIHTELVGETVLAVVVADCLPTFALVTSESKLLHSADYGPPFNRFGPLVSQLGEFYRPEDLLDFWTRTPVGGI